MKNRIKNFLTDNNCASKFQLETYLPVTYLHEDPPPLGVAQQIADGIWMIRLPISLAMDHVNVYVLDNGDGWALVDTGCDMKDSRETLLGALNQPPFAGKPINHVIATHFHPDHIGLAGYFTTGKNGHNAQLLTSRTSWHSTWVLLNDDAEVPHGAHAQFVQRAGMRGMEFESFKRCKPSRYAEKVARLPVSYHRICDQDELIIGNRTWEVRTGDGHADEHVTLISNDNIAIVGDQILPAISPNLSVHFSEPNANCVEDWIGSCRVFAAILNNSTLCLPGHNRPFTGAPSRCKQLIENCHQVSDRIVASLVKPKTAIELMPDIYRRDLAAYERNLLIGETIGYLNYLLADGRVTRRLTSDGCFLWRRPPNFERENSRSRNDS